MNERRTISRLVTVMKTVFLWILTVLFAVTGTAFMGIDVIGSGIAALAFAALVLPVPPWQRIVGIVFRVKLKVIAAAVLAVVTVSMIPAADIFDTDDMVYPVIATADDAGSVPDAPGVFPTQGITAVSVPCLTEQITTERSTEPVSTPTEELTEIPTTVPMPEPAVEPSFDTDEKPSVESEAEEDAAEYDYVLNTNTHKFHHPGCSSVADMREKNKSLFSGSRNDVIDMGYEPCGRCKP